MLAEILIFGTVEGLILALLAIGLSLVFGVGGVMNLGHGGFYLITCYSVFWLLKYTATPLLVSMAIAVGITALIGALVYIFLIKPLQGSPIGVLMATFSFAFFLEQFIVMTAGTTLWAIPPIWPGGLELWGVPFPAQFAVTMIGSLIIILSIYLFIKKSKLGKSIRAVAQDREAAELMGINTNRILMIVVVISAILAGFAAIFYAPSPNVITPYMGWSTLMSAFAVVIFGGMGSILGSILAAFVMAYARMFCNIAIDPAFATLLPIIVIIIVLIVRPQGLLGKKEVD